MKARDRRFESRSGQFSFFEIGRLPKLSASMCHALLWFTYMYLSITNTSPVKRCNMQIVSSRYAYPVVDWQIDSFAAAAWSVDIVLTVWQLKLLHTIFTTKVWTAVGHGSLIFSPFENSLEHSKTKVHLMCVCMGHVMHVCVHVCVCVCEVGSTCIYHNLGRKS